MKKIFLLPVLVIALAFVSCQKETVEPQPPTQEEPGIKQKMTGPTTGETQTDYTFTATSSQYQNSNYTYKWTVSPSSGAQLVNTSGYSATYKFADKKSYEVTITYSNKDGGSYAAKEAMVITIDRDCIPPPVCPKPHYANLSISGPEFCHTGPFNPDPLPYIFTANITNPNDNKYNWTLTRNGQETGFVAGGRIAEVEFTEYGNHFLRVQAVCLTCNKAVASSREHFISVTIHGEEWWNQ